MKSAQSKLPGFASPSGGPPKTKRKAYRTKIRSIASQVERLLDELYQASGTEDLSDVIRKLESIEMEFGVLLDFITPERKKK